MKVTPPSSRFGYRSFLQPTPPKQISGCGQPMKTQQMFGRWIIATASLAVVVTTTAPVQAASVSLTASDALGQTSWNTGTRWSNSLAPSVGNDYFTAGFTLRTPATNATSLTFAGDSLTLNGGSLTYKSNVNATITINNLTFSDGVFGQGGSGSIATLAGSNMRIADGKFADFDTAASTRTINVSASIGGVGGEFRVRGPGTLNLQGINTYTGNTLINVSTTTLNLVDNAGLLFAIGASGVNNWVTGIGNVNFNGDFTFDLSSAASNGSWNIVDVAGLTESYGSTFTVKDFTESTPGIWSRTFGASTYTFSELTGQLSAIPEPSSIALLGLGSMLLAARRRR